ncbi:hypothetical protein [Pacificibacter maritimus]|nr:hypothetical protein [Pacificibacter maritimus]
MNSFKKVALCLVLTPLPAFADEFMQCEFEVLPVSPQPAWVENFDLCNDDIRRFVEARALGFEFYAPALEQFSNLTASDQLLVMEVTQAVVPTDNGLEQDLRIPMPLIDAILEEALENGADDFFEIPGFEETLMELRESGDIGARSLGFVAAKAPLGIAKIYFLSESSEIRRSVRALNAAQSDLETSEQRLETSRQRLEDVEEQARLARELEDGAARVGETAQGLRGILEGN